MPVSFSKNISEVFLFETQGYIVVGESCFSPLTVAADHFLIGLCKTAASNLVITYFQQEQMCVCIVEWTPAEPYTHTHSALLRLIYSRRLSQISWRLTNVASVLVFIVSKNIKQAEGHAPTIYRLLFCRKIILRPSPWFLSMLLCPFSHLKRFTQAAYSFALSLWN